MIPSKILLNSREMGLQLEFLEASPSLKIGITFAILSLSGKIPIRNDTLMTCESCMEMCGSSTFNNFTGIPFGPE